MKKLITILTTLALIVGAMGVQVFAEETESSVSATVSISDGTIVMAQKTVTVTDVDEDGAITINDALYLAHESAFEGGAEAGYQSEMGDYGLMLTKLWGIENGGSYGYYVNNTAAMSLGDAISDGDNIYAFVYTDTENFSDTYCFFHQDKVEAACGEEISLTLSKIGFDENWAPVVLPVEAATIVVDGTATEYVTDAEGKVTVTFEAEGEYLISAISDSLTMVPPICMATVATVSAEADTTEEADTTVEADTTEEADTAVEADTTVEAVDTTASETVEAPQTGDAAMTILVIAMAAALMVVMVAIRRRADENR